MQINEFDYQSLDAVFGDYKERVQKILNGEMDLNKIHGANVGSKF